MKKTARTAFVLMWLLVATVTGYSQQGIFEAASEGNLAEVKWCLEHGYDLEAGATQNMTALWCAASCGHLDVVKFLVGKGANMNIGLGYCVGWTTPLMEAAEKGHLDVVKFLVKSGSDVNAHPKLGDTPLLLAARSGHLDVVKFLVDKGANVNKGDWHGGTPLKYATHYGKKDVAKFLKQHGAKE